MIWKIVEETIFLLLAFLDAEFTKQKIAMFGLEVELNKTIKWLVKLLGFAGVDLGIVVPTGILGIAGWYYPQLLAFLIGVRFCLFLFQQQSRYLNGKSKDK